MNSRTYARIYEPLLPMIEEKTDRIKNNSIHSVSRQYILNTLEKMTREGNFDADVFSRQEGWQFFSRPGVIRHVMRFNLANNVMVKAEIDIDMLDSPTHEGWRAISDTIASGIKRSKEKCDALSDKRLATEEKKLIDIDSVDIDSMFCKQSTDMAFLNLSSKGEFYIDVSKNGTKGHVFVNSYESGQECMFSRYTNFDAEYKRITSLGYRPVNSLEFLDCFILIEDMTPERLYSIYSEAILLALNKDDQKSEKEEEIMVEVD